MMGKNRKRRRRFLSERTGLLFLLLAGLAAVTVAGIFDGAAWWIDLFTHFKLHYAILGLVFAAVLGISRRWILGLAAAGLTVVNFWGYTEGLAGSAAGASASNSARSLKILSFNVFYENDRFTAVDEFIRSENADVVFLIEITERWDGEIRKLKDVYPYRRQTQVYENLPGIPLYDTVLSRIPFDDYRDHYSLSGDRAFAQEVDLRVNGEPIHLVGVHLTYAVLPEMAGWQQRELESLAAMAERRRGETLVIGDFNMTPHSRRFREFLRRNGLRQALGDGSATWPGILGPLGISIDHVLAGRRLAAAAMRTGPHIGSDHLPVIAAVSLGR